MPNTAIAASVEVNLAPEDAVFLCHRLRFQKYLKVCRLCKTCVRVYHAETDVTKKMMTAAKLLKLMVPEVGVEPTRSVSSTGF